MTLSGPLQAFVTHFGEMGNRWGINRTVGQIYALLYIVDHPLCADEIGTTLQSSRSNISVGLKELDSWRLIRVKHFFGDRKDYYTVPEDIWEIVRTLVEERKKREIDPIRTMLRQLITIPCTNPQETAAQEKMQQMYNLIELLTAWYNDLQTMTTEQLAKLLQLGSKLYKAYELKDKLPLISNNKSQNSINIVQGED